VYWPAILLSAGEPLPTEIGVHDYLTIGGSKISKSGPLASEADPVALAGRYGTDALRWWLLREVPRTGDADFTAARLVARANDDLANDLGNLVSRVVALVHRYRDGRVPRAVISEDPQRSAASASALTTARRRAPERIAAALATFDFRVAAAAIWDVVEEANRYVERAEPWRLARAERDGEASAGELLDGVLALLVGTCADLGQYLAPFLPGLAGRIGAACDDSAGRLPAPQPVFPRLADAEVAVA
jgi:methionyl-tRNA synthetase